MILKELTKHTLLVTFCLSLMACGSGSSGAPDADGDGIPDASDMFPNDPKESKDSDNDGVGDNADAFPLDATETKDSDADGVGDNIDVFPQDASESKDSDADGIGDNADAFPLDATETKDSDGDGVGDNTDVFPLDATETKDFDGNGVGDNADLDDDKDGTPDLNDAFPFDKTEQADVDGDKIGDNKDLDLTSTNPNSIQLDRFLETKRATKFIGAHSLTDERYAKIGNLVKIIGDVNGDGFQDLFIGNYRVRENDKAVGMGYILFGQAEGWPATVDLANLSNVPHITLKGEGDDSEEMGAGVTPLGDIDQDGIDDFMVAASLLSNESSTEPYNGTVFLVFGRSTWLQDAGDDKIITSAELTNFAVTFKSKLKSGRLGAFLENVGDLNNDGSPEVAISENTFGFYSSDVFGRVHLMFNIGRFTQANMGEHYNIEDVVNTADTLNRVVLEDGTDYFVYAIQAMGDFNDDGFDDVILYDRTSDKDPEVNAYGSLYIIFGKASHAWANTWDLNNLAQGEGMIFSNIGGGEFDSRLGRDFKVADLNADSIPDVLISRTSDHSARQNNNISEFYVLWGGAKNWPATIASNNIAAEFGLTMFSEEAKVSLGATLEILPDTNNNGYPELLVSTADNELMDADNPAEQVYKFDASLIKQGLKIGPSMLDESQAERFTMSYIEEDDVFFMNTLGDMNGDGLSEFTFSASRKDTNGLTNNGEFYLIYGYQQLYLQVSE